MKILVAGFGAMGCRHAQSILESGLHEVYVAEPDTAKFENGLAAINASPASIRRRYISVEEAGDNTDLAIIATSSHPRFRIVKTLLEKGVKRFLLEKIVFQSPAQFDEIIELAKEKKAGAWCNFVNRYFENYISLRQIMEKRSQPLSMHVTGGNFGLGSNAVHYADIFEYLTGSAINITSSCLQLSGEINRRGKQYVEFTGGLYGNNMRGDIFTLHADSSHSTAPVITLCCGKNIFQLHQGSGKETDYSEPGTHEKEFRIIPSSILTARIIDDIFSGQTVLTPLHETRNTHTALFTHFNAAAGLENKYETLCPVT